jgi:hypothetical protein
MWGTHGLVASPPPAGMPTFAAPATQLCEATVATSVPAGHRRVVPQLTVDVRGPVHAVGIRQRQRRARRSRQPHESHNQLYPRPVISSIKLWRVSRLVNDAGEVQELQERLERQERPAAEEARPMAVQPKGGQPASGPAPAAWQDEKDALLVRCQTTSCGWSAVVLAACCLLVAAASTGPRVARTSAILTSVRATSVHSMRATCRMRISAACYQHASRSSLRSTAAAAGK